MLDPIKFGIVCPGMKKNGELDASGIPADVVSAYLSRSGIVPSRTTDHMVLFLFSVGVTKGKWGTLINALLDFKRDYDRNAPLAEVVPHIAAAGGARYAGMGLGDLANEMWGHMRKSKQGEWQAKAYAQLPTPMMTPRRAFQRLMAGKAEKVPLSKMAGRTVAVGVIPYPPGIPIVMPGESAGAERWPVAHVSARLPGIRRTLPRVREGSGGDGGSEGRIPHLLPHEVGIAFPIRRTAPKEGETVEETKKKMSVVQLTFIVAVNMMGSGIIMLPANMAQVGAISLLSWIVTAVGSMAIAYGFAQAGIFNQRAGGMAAYAEDAYGKDGYFQVFFLYFLSLAIGNVADRDLGGRLSLDVLPLHVEYADRHLHQRDRAPLAHDGRELRRPDGDREDRLRHRLGRDPARRLPVVRRLVLVQRRDVHGSVESAGAQHRRRAWVRASR